MASTRTILATTPVLFHGCEPEAIGLAATSPRWIWRALRWLAGILGTVAACFMIHRILGYRNTQAATGVLFVAVILTFIGELTADLLQRAVHVPF